MTRVLACGLAFAALLAGAAVAAQPVTEEEVGTGVAMVSVREVHLRGLDNLNGTARDIGADRDPLDAAEIGAQLIAVG